MEKTWRWFGRKDNITLPELKQIGVEGIVTSLYHLPNGSVWPMEEILALKNFILKNGLRWSVVESLPVAETIKYGGADRNKLIENYKLSLKNLGMAGIKTVWYNFMPVIDWIRTDLNYPQPDGTSTLCFDKIKFAYFDRYVLIESVPSNITHRRKLKRPTSLTKTLPRWKRMNPFIRSPSKRRALLVAISMMVSKMRLARFKGS